MSLLDIPMPTFTGPKRVQNPLGNWPAPPSAAKSEANRIRAVNARAKQKRAA